MNKNMINVMSSVFLLIFGVVALILPVLKIFEVKWLFLAAMVVFGLCEIIKFVANKDKRNLSLGVCSEIIGILFVLLQSHNEPLTLSFCLLAWIMVTAFIKLFQIDYYHDRNDEAWKLHLLNFLFFLFLGVLTSINLYYSQEIQLLMLGFFFFAVSANDLLTHAKMARK